MIVAQIQVEQNNNDRDSAERLHCFTHSAAAGHYLEVRF
jgi:hypothetical protein